MKNVEKCISSESCSVKMLPPKGEQEEVGKGRVSRQARLDAPGVLHHVMGRGIERSRIFWDDCDKEDFIRRLL